MTPDDAGRGGASASWLRPAATALGLLLVAAAAVAVALRREELAAALRAVARPGAAPLALLAAAVAANVGLSGALFSVLVRPHGRVGLIEMQALIAASTLLNFLPAKPGVLGRIAWHRLYNAIPATATVTTILQAAGLSVLVAAYLAGGLAASSRLGFSLWIVVAAPLPVLGLAAAWRAARVPAAAVALRYAELLVWAVRYHAAFALVGTPVDHGSALALACVSMVTMLVPFFGNGLGIREWAIGLASPHLAGAALGAGLAAELVNRGAEIAVVALLGGAGSGWLARRRLRAPGRAS